MKFRIIYVLTVLQILTVLLYFFGPINYLGKPKSDAVFWFVVFYLFMLNAGYFFARNLYLVGRSGPKTDTSFVKNACLLSLFFLPFTFYTKIGSVSLELNIGEMYNRSAEVVENSDSSFQYFKMIFGYFFFGLLPVYLHAFNRLNKMVKVMGGFLILMNIMITILTGVNKVLFDSIIIGFAFFLQKLKVKKIFNLKNIAYALLISLFLVGASIFFVEGQKTREGSSAISGINPNTGSYSTYNIDDGDGLLFYSAMTSYLTQGYRAFDLSLDEEFDFTWGVGNSTFFSRQIDRFFDTNISDKTYPAKLEDQGWDRYNYWSTFYVWWASDLGFFGVGFLMFFLGYIFRCIENTKDTIVNDTASKILYYYLVVLCFYLSANNQIFQSGEGSVGFLSLVIPFFFFRKISSVRSMTKVNR